MSTEKSTENIIEVSHLSKTFNLEAGFFAKNKQNVYAVNDVSFSIPRGSTYGIAGESGCGKTTTARLIIQMYKQTSGTIQFLDTTEKLSPDVSAYTKKQLRLYREKVKYIFQDPARSLNPRLTVYEVLTAGLKYSSQWKDKASARQLAEKIITEVGLSPADLERRPAEFSGGQRQRISIARGLIMNPSLLICDEVVSALDVSIQGQIINLLQDLRQSRNLSYIFITHDLKVASYFCDTIGVMYRGYLVEEAPAADLYKTAVHPYTKLLFEGAQGVLNSSNQEVKTTLAQENCCPFAYRCPKATARCKSELPEFKQISENHRVRCFE
ncbi:MAG: ABC transporter ATP-binding protein [Treponema sp.]|nr:ABC transporter ATP-binding protein [Treponema sp.]